MEFKPPDNLRQALRLCKNRHYRKLYFRWLRCGPDEAHDAQRFNQQWETAGKEGQSAVAQYYLDQRARRQTSLTHHKSDVLTFYTIVAAVTAAVAAVASKKLQNLIEPAEKPVIALILIALVMALSSYTNRMLYPLYTHFMGAAEYGHDVVHHKSYINKVRKETNNLSRTLQRGKRRFSLSKLLIYAAGLYLVTQNLRV